MKRTMVLVAAVLALCLSSSLASFGGAQSGATDYIIRVTSGTLGQEVRFEAAVLVKSPEAPFQTISRKTPFEFRTTGYAASAMFRSGDDAMISVEVVGNQAGRQVSRSTATGRAVVVGNNLVSELQGFITSF